MNGTKSRRISSQSGYASLAIVAAISGIIIMGLVLAFRGATNAHDSQNETQTRVDLAQAEDAFLRSLIAVIPNKAVATMREEDTSLWPKLSWDAIFQEALKLSFGDSLSDGGIVSNLIGSGYVSANRAEVYLSLNEDGFSPVLENGNALVNSGTITNSALVDGGVFAGRLPDPLVAPGLIMDRDGSYPIISLDKQFSESYANDARLSVQKYPLYNLIPYPNIHFGFTRPGLPFLAKRNWWAFSVDYGKATKYPLKKNYVISIYEVPSQTPISASSFMLLGQHSDGSEWTNALIEGNVTSGSVQTTPGFRITNGGLAVRSAASIASGTSLNGNTFDSTFDNLGVRESRRIEMGTDANLMSLSANSGRVAFIPINPGLEFYEVPDSYETQILSDTGWKKYSRGAAQCAMTLRIIQVADALVQMPTALEFTYKTGSTSTGSITLTRGVNWPTNEQTGGRLIPFQTEHLETGREALIVYPQRLAAYLASLGGADLSVNHSLAINPDPSRSALIKVPEFPTSGTDTAVTLRESADFSSFPKGFALVTNLRLYLADDFNQVEVPAPSNAGVPTGEPFYPPVALFAPEKRYGTTLKIRPVKYKGQVGSLAQGTEFPSHPLDFRAGTHETITPGLIEADLKPIVSPAQLAPVHLMNWLVTIEELRSQ